MQRIGYTREEMMRCNLQVESSWTRGVAREKEGSLVEGLKVEATFTREIGKEQPE